MLVWPFSFTTYYAVLVCCALICFDVVARVLLFLYFYSRATSFAAMLAFS